MSPGLVFLVTGPVQHKYFSSQAGFSSSSLNSLRRNSEIFCHEFCHLSLAASPPAWQETKHRFCYLRVPASVSNSRGQQVTQSGQHTCQMDEAQIESRVLGRGLFLQNRHVSAVFKKTELLSNLLTLELTVMLFSRAGIWESRLTAAKARQKSELCRKGRWPCRAGPAQVALKSHQQQQGLALVGIITSLVHVGVSLHTLKG